MKDIEYASISEVSVLLIERQVSPIELTRTLLDRIATIDPLLNAFISVFADSALAAASRAESEILRGDVRGPLHGVPYSLKDLIETVEGQTTAGSLVLAEYVAPADATVVRRMEAAGAILVGKTNLFEFAYGSPHPHYRASRNPWNREYATGGSSSGSAAAVAAGLGYASLGTDTGGSIRVPSAWCGLVGVKPTYGRVSLAGVIPLASTLDHVGPLTRTVRDAAIVLQAISGHDPLDSTSLTAAVPDFVQLLDDGPVALTIGVDLAIYEANVDPDIFAAVQRATELLRDLGATIVPIQLPDVEQAVESIQTILKAEAASFHRAWLNEDAARYSPAVRARLESGLSVLAIDYLAAVQRRSQLRAEYLALLETADVLLTPTTTRGPMTVETLEDERPSAHGDPLHQRIRFTGPINATGLPALSVPCGMTDAGLPIGMQLIGRPLDESRLLATAHRYEQAAGWSARHPQLP